MAYVLISFESFPCKESLFYNNYLNSSPLILAPYTITLLTCFVQENNEPSSILPVVPSIKTRQEDEVSLPLSKLLLARTDDDYHGGLTLQFGKTTVDDSDSDSENSDREDAKKKKKKAMAKKTGNKKKTNAVKSNAKKGDAEKERIEQEKAEKERLERERLEKEKLEKERLEKERLEKERLEKEELRKEKIKNDKLELLKELIKHKKHNKRDIISLDVRIASLSVDLNFSGFLTCF